jgi:FMN phosphatase YigB (HAD superfamily)
MIREARKNTRSRIFTDVMRFLKNNNKKYKFIIITDSGRSFVRFKIKTENVDKYFSKIYSSVDDFNTGKGYSGSSKMFLSICRSLKIKPEEMLHVGDSYTRDFIRPRYSGIKTVLLDRKGKRSGKCIIRNMNQLESVIRELNEKSK